MLYLKCKDFINEFKLPLDYNEIISKIDEISKINCEKNDCNQPVTISFQDMPEFGIGARVKDGNIRFNKTRLETLIELKIDCLDENNLNKLWKFYNSFDENNDKNSIYEVSLFNFMKKYIEEGAERYFSDCGSYKLIPYELLECVFHENAHVFQREYDKYLNGDLEFPSDEKSCLLIFTEAFDMIHHKLKKNNIAFDYKRNNYIFPVEFDARYEAMIKMNELKNKYYKNDNIFSKYLVASNIVPLDLNIEKTAQEIFETFEYFYDTYKSNFGSDYDKVAEYSMMNKVVIINEMKRRYDEMLSIVNENNFNNEKN